MTHKTECYNYGLALLRLWMCFEVVVGHCSINTPPPLLNNIFFGYAVPVFMLMSFFLANTEQIAKDTQYCKHRFFRLLVPQIVWAVVYWVFYNSVHLILHTDTKEGIASLLWQITFGYTVNGTMWYQADLIFLTILFSVFFLICKNRSAYHYLPFFALVALFLTYSGVWAKLTMPLRDEVRAPLARFIGMVPLAVVGMLFRGYSIPQKLRQKQPLMLLYTAISLGFCFGFQIFYAPTANPGYAGISVITIATLLVIFFFLLPLEKTPEKIQKAISAISRYTMGIYCMHRMIRHMYRVTTNLEGNDLVFSCLVFVTSLIISALIARLPWRWTKVCVA